MRISAKTRYGIAALIHLAQNSTEDRLVPILSISEALGISKIYLEQVFSLLKRGDIVVSVKGAQGGYLLSRPANEITMLEVFKAIEQTLFENTEETVPAKGQEIEKAMKDVIFDRIDNAIEVALVGITLLDMVHEAKKNKSTNEFMFFI
ncbi:RrF2 family transcriptional regulator [Youngiibacter fragilis]|uniref:Rrf2 family transcriptional regulator n=1 Tax=Youngiibacter fragilis 232.1 TaxID=994573 RepID=V7I5Z1_9CLOT|nr:Rrf2 family transcriptional regulator [Youngiibacter fragilis]ETA81620.1 Rrf2 family transcriptional regulator [Youngiibacter fragilis 232.1]